RAPPGPAGLRSPPPLAAPLPPPPRRLLRPGFLELRRADPRATERRVRRRRPHRLPADRARRPAPFTVDHLAILGAVRRTVHVDPDRTFAVGYSTGGYAAWAVALFHSDQLAGAVALGSVFTVPPSEDGLWKKVLGNLAQVPVI